MSHLPADPLLELLVELRDLKVRVAGLTARVNEAIIAQGAGCCPPTTHQYAPPQHVAPFCAEDEPPSRPV